MYKVTGPDKEIFWNHHPVAPVLTLVDEHGGRVQIVMDDHCYVILHQQENGSYKQTPWIFKEAFQALKHLPDPE